ANKKSDLFEFLQQNYGDALAVEMEGRGILEAVHANQQVSGLIIRGISDLIDGKSRADKEGFQELAASHASAFAFQVLAKLWVLWHPKSQVQQKWERPLQSEKGKRQEVKALLQKQGQGQVQPPVREPQSSGYVPLDSAVGVDYTNLRDLLVAKNWKEADLETEKRMLEVTCRKSQRYLDIEDVENFPSQDLGTIDKLWVEYSDGKFGFSVQKKIYRDLGGTKDYDDKVWKSFADKVGWRKGGNWLSYSNLTLTFIEGHYMGQFPARLVLYEVWGFWFSRLVRGGWVALLSRRDL
ncbi:MAG: GUN4 domain-containing protein, partial [Trichodesmium sp. St7_bin2_1]|nr:GUN4 domain-containing protein [Trichodesmium sp. St7_bin2_1]